MTLNNSKYNLNLVVDILESTLKLFQFVHWKNWNVLNILRKVSFDDKNFYKIFNKFIYLMCS